MVVVKLGYFTKNRAKYLTHFELCVVITKSMPTGISKDTVENIGYRLSVKKKK